MPKLVADVLLVEPELRGAIGFRGRVRPAGESTVPRRARLDEAYRNTASARQVLTVAE
jgi:hypothetical protein